MRLFEDKILNRYGVELAQSGIIYIDEIDRIASIHGLTGPDVSQRP
jgi:ATP-dependent protease Clp ATPase subunit